MYTYQFNQQFDWKYKIGQTIRQQMTNYEKPIHNHV